MPSLKEIFDQFAETIVPEIQAVSKRFAPSIESKVTEKESGITLEILASPYITTLIDGRKPTSPTAPKGNPTLQQILLEWIKSKGIQPYANAKGNIPTLEQLSWAMSNSMHKKGDLLWQRGGGNNIFDPIITDNRINNLTNLVNEYYFTTIESQVIKNIA